MKINNKILGFAIASIAILLRSVHSVAIKYMINELEMSSQAILFLRYSTGTLFLIFLSIPIINKKEIKKLFNKKNNILKNKNFWFASLSLFGTSVFLHLSLKFTSASLGMILLTMAPVIVVLHTMYFFPEKIKNYISIRKIFFTVLITSIGSAMLIGDNSFVLEKNIEYKYIGDIFAMIAAFCGVMFDIYFVELRNDYKKANGLLITSLYLSVGALLSIPIGVYYLDTIFPLTQIKLLLILLLGAGSTGLASLFWFLSARYLNAIILSLLGNILGITTIITEFIIYGDKTPFTPNLIIGGLMIIFSTIYITHLTNKK